MSGRTKHERTEIPVGAAGGHAYKRLHWWLNYHWPRAGRCERCGEATTTEYAFMFQGDPYTWERDDYLELCRPCHVLRDTGGKGRRG